MLSILFWSNSNRFLVILIWSSELASTFFYFKTINFIITNFKGLVNLGILAGPYRTVWPYRIIWFWYGYLQNRERGHQKFTWARCAWNLGLKAQNWWLIKDNSYCMYEQTHTAAMNKYWLNYWYSSCKQRYEQFYV